MTEWSSPGRTSKIATSSMRGIDAHAHMSRSFEVGAARMMTNLRIEICHPALASGVGVDRDPDRYETSHPGRYVEEKLKLVDREV